MARIMALILPMAIHRILVKTVPTRKHHDAMHSWFGHDSETGKAGAVAQLCLELQARPPSSGWEEGQAQGKVLFSMTHVGTPC